MILLGYVNYWDLLSLILGDSWFAIIALTELVEQLWVSSQLLSFHYIIIAGGLICILNISYQSKSLFILIKKKTFF
jgi:hypothetical protein